MLRPQLKFSCPENWEKMTPVTGGRFCGSCEKVVIDFSGMSDAEILAMLRNNTTQLCGRFRNEQLENPFGDYRDHVLRLYRRANEIPEKRYFVKTMMLCLAVSLLFLTSCRGRKCTHTQGDVRIYDFGETKAHQQKPSQQPANW